MIRTFALAAALSLGLAACSEGGAPPKSDGQTPMVAPVLDTPDAVDIHSFAKPLVARVTHVALDLNVDFDAKRIGGTATLDIDRKPDAKEIVLDDKGLEIESIADASKQPLQYRSARRTRTSAPRSPSR